VKLLKLIGERSVVHGRWCWSIPGREADYYVRPAPDHWTASAPLVGQVMLDATAHWTMTPSAAALGADPVAAADVHAPPGQGLTLDASCAKEAGPGCSGATRGARTWPAAACSPLRTPRPPAFGD